MVALLSILLETTTAIWPHFACGFVWGKEDIEKYLKFWRRPFFKHRRISFEGRRNFLASILNSNLFAAFENSSFYHPAAVSCFSVGEVAVFSFSF